MTSNDGLTQASVLEILKGVKFPNLSRDIVSFGLVKGIDIEDGLVRVKIRVSSLDKNVPAAIEHEISRVLHDLPSIREVQVDMSWVQPESAPAPHAPHSSPSSSEPILTGVKTKIAVASGKGGVGKSTIAAGLALMLKARGLRVGLVDFDIYGPSIPTIMGVQDKPRVLNNRIQPLDCNGLKLMSMGFLVEPGTPMIWRGPMVHQATEQFLRDVDWGDLDVLVVDLPPGTGDAQMTLSQKVELDGAIIVSTPQDLALIDARKGVAMFQKMGVPILGIVENMSGFTCPHCGETSYIFGRGGAEEEAREQNVPLLARIPLVPALVRAMDEGDLVRAIESEPELTRIYSEMAARVAEQIHLTPVSK